MEHGNWKEMYEAACRGDIELVEYYIRIGVDLDYAHPEFMSTALVSSILAEQQDVALLLLDNGADPTLLSPWDEMTPMKAATSRDLELVKARLRALGAT